VTSNSLIIVTLREEGVPIFGTPSSLIVLETSNIQVTATVSS